MNVTPNQISNLKSNEIFVFGSNLQGDHAGGAAKFAVKAFGAEMGNGDGIQGQSYAIPTLSAPAYHLEDLDELKLPISVIGKYVRKFISFAENNPNLYFYVTPIGCGIAGFTEQEIAPLFSGCANLDNVALPQSFIDILDINENKKNMKKLIRLTESDLHIIIENSVSRILNEIGDTREGQYALGKLSARKDSKRGDNDRNDVDDYADKRRNEKIKKSFVTSKDKKDRDTMEDDFWDGYQNLPFKHNSKKKEKGEN